MRQNRTIVLCAAGVALAAVCVLVDALMGADREPARRRRSYAPPPLVHHEGGKPDPQEDFVALCKFAEAHGGRLVTADDEVVKWRDTYLFRMFELKHHTVVIFPYDWTEDRFDLIVFAGHVKDYKNAFASVFYKLHDEERYYYNDTMAIDLSPPAVGDVSFEGFHLGESGQDLALREWEYKRRTSSDESHINACVRGALVRPGRIDANRGELYFGIHFEDGRVSYMNWYHKATPQLGGYKIDEPVTPVRAEGEFDVPEEVRASGRAARAAPPIRVAAVRPEGAGPRVYAEWPFDPEEARRRQEGTAQALGLPKEGMIDLGGGVQLEMVLIPAGEFVMGDRDPEHPAWDFNMVPRHRVRITQPFYVSKYEITQRQWTQVMGRNPSRFRGPDHPVEQASWNDCVAFVQKLNAQVDAPGTFDLPTEAEWEHACRAGTQTSYCFGDLASTDQVNCDGSYARDEGREEIYRGTTLPVGSFPPNAFGLYDMHGNVSEFCKDWYDSQYYEESPTDDPPGPDAGRARSLRGGSWAEPPRNCRSGSRSRLPPKNWFSFYGCRVVLRNLGD